MVDGKGKIVANESQYASPLRILRPAIADPHFAPAKIAARDQKKQPTPDANESRYFAFPFHALNAMDCVSLNPLESFSGCVE